MHDTENHCYFKSELTHGCQSSKFKQRFLWMHKWTELTTFCHFHFFKTRIGIYFSFLFLFSTDFASVLNEFGIISSGFHLICWNICISIWRCTHINWGSLLANNYLRSVRHLQTSTSTSLTTASSQYCVVSKQWPLIQHTVQFNCKKLMHWTSRTAKSVIDNVLSKS